MKRTSWIWGVALAVVVAVTAAPAQRRSRGANPPAAESQSAAPMQAQAPGAIPPQYDQKLYEGMKYRLIGPFRGGRVLAVTGDPDEPNTYYMGTVSGGVWKSTDGGLNWTPLTDKTQISSVGAIAIAPSAHNTLYVGTGEACIRGNITYGDGVYKTTDGGKTWQHIGLEDTRQIGRVAVDPTNPDRVFVAAFGHAFAPNAERGLFRTLDGGKTWEKVLFVDDKTGAIDVSIDPNSPNTVFAAMWQAYRAPWTFESGGPGSGLYKSTDGGNTWKKLNDNQGFPKGVIGRIGVAVSPVNGNRVYAAIEAKEGGVYTSNDGGDTWHKVNGESRFTQRAWYYMHIFADPKIEDRVYILNTGLYRSDNQGRTWETLRAPHGDHHGLWIDPKNNDRLINSNDGGATVSTDGGKSWTSQMTQPTAQFYHVATDNRFRYYIYGAQQDNSTVAIASSTNGGTIGASDWYDVGGGESGFVVPYPPNPNIVFAGSYDGLITKYDHETGTEEDINPWPDNPMGWPAAPLKYRFQWTAPIALSPHDPNVLYMGANVIFKSTNMGQSWTQISQDLTRNDKSKEQPAGGPITKDETSVEYYDTVFAIAESPVKANLIWAGSDDGLVHVTSDGGQHWDNVTPKDLPEWGTVSMIDPSATDANTAYLAVDRHRMDDLNPYAWVTHDLGKTWTKITNGIPVGSYVHAVRQDPVDKNLLFAGTETGVFVSWDDGAHWQALKLNLPRTPVHDLVIHGDNLVVATHGRAFWSLDDITPLRQMSSQVAGAEVHFFTPAPAVRTQGGRGFGGRFGGGAVGQNPMYGVVFDYYLKDAPKGPATLDILDSSGKVIQNYSSVAPKRRGPAEQPDEFEEFFGPQTRLLPAKAGENRFNWDFSTENPATVPGLAQWGGRPRGPMVPTGHYQARLTVNGQQYTQAFDVKEDPRLKVTDADLQKQYELASQIAHAVDEANRAANQMRDVQSQIKQLKDRYEDLAAAKPVLAEADNLDKKITPVLETIVQTQSKASEDPLNYPVRLNNKLMILQGTVESATGEPTQQSYQVFQELNQQLQQALGQWKQIQDTDLANFNKAVQSANLPLLVVGKGSSE